MVVQVDAGDGALAHADGRAAVAGDEAAEELEGVGIVAHDEDAVAAGVLGQHVLKVGVGSVGTERRADLDFGVVAEFRADQLRGLQGALERARHDDLDLRLERAQHARH